VTRTDLASALATVGIIALMGAFFSLSADGGEMSYRRPSSASSTNGAILPPVPPPVMHVETPKPLKAIYMTSCVGATPSWRKELVKMIEDTELNAIVMDIKDYTGTISFPIQSTEFMEATNGCFVSDMKDFIKTLHEKQIYVIGRVQVFQDGAMTKSRPDLAVKTKDGAVWKDRKGISFIDVGAKEYWDHVIDLAKLSYEVGFDEVNFDYIRYPSDGDMKNIAFPHSGSTTKPVMLERFFMYLRAAIPQGAPVISADVFGMTTVNTDDLNIGQVLERALPHFDYVAPMVYPSHFPTGFNGWKNPNDVPGDVIRYSMGKGVERAVALEKLESGFVPSTSTPTFVPTGKYKDRLRPWLQDFDYGGDYDATDVRAQIQATYDVGLESWMLWDPGNKYTRSALKLEGKP
jgi:hypothetical protein